VRGDEKLAFPQSQPVGRIIILFGRTLILYGKVSRPVGRIIIFAWKAFLPVGKMLIFVGKMFCPVGKTIKLIWMAHANHLKDN